MDGIRIDGVDFKDEAGRTLMLRGVNLGGSSKVPYVPDGSTWNPEGFYDHRKVSFVGRPFPLEEADRHFERLRAWGITFLRFLITWEAIEHAGPGLYDEAYLDYLRAVIVKAGDHGLRVFIDPHQDVWSRFSGGDGAPGWTLEAVGFDLPHLHATGAALLHQEHGDPFPKMIWATNYNKLACATMFTLFFGGDLFAPHLKVEGQPVQEYLQSHYLNAIRQAVLRLRNLPNVAGWDTLNEPHNGYIGETDLNRYPSGMGMLKGGTPTILQSLLLGSGVPQIVDTYELGLTGFRKTGRKQMNPGGLSAWRPGYADLWRQEGVWDLDGRGGAVILRPEHFCRVDGRPVDFNAGHLKPFANRFARAVREIVPEAIIFVEGVPSQSGLRWGPEDAPNVVHAAHWYDDVTLVRKHYIPWLALDSEKMKVILGTGAARRSRHEQIARLHERSASELGGVPTLVGEVGIPFDMQSGRAYRSGDFSMQTRALDATMQALEGNFTSFTLWNYTSDNSNERGDQWNGEDLSLFSPDQMKGTGGLDDGGRALKAALRPYPCKTAGRALRLSFEVQSRQFEFSFRHDPAVEAPTQVVIPEYQYPQGFEVEVSDGAYEWDASSRLLTYFHTPGREDHTLKLKPRS